MSIWSSIGSAISAVGSAISSSISSLCSGIGGALFSGTGGVATIAKAFIAPVIGLGLPEILLAVQAVGAIISVVAEILGLKKEEESPEELGMKAEQADKKPEDFESTQAYIEYLRKEVQVDKDKLENLTDAEKIGYGAVGSALYAKGIEEKYGMQMSGDFWTTVSQMKMSGQEVKTYIDNFKMHDITDMKDMTDYIKGVPLADGKDRGNISSAMIESLREINPGMSDEILEEKLLDMGV
ncbi:MAG: hypothetical protein Q4F66_05875 [Clostridium sp.]|nr:hypothetical protein [Clostridium sp.]